MSYIESFKAVMDEARILMADCDMLFLDKLQAAHDAEMKQLSKEEFHRGYESGVAARDAEQWQLDRERAKIIEAVMKVVPEGYFGSDEMLSEICRAIYSPVFGWTAEAGRYLCDRLIYLLGGKNVKLPAEPDAEFYKNGENHQTSGYDVLGNERNKVVGELRKLRDRGSVWGRELVVALGLSVEATNDDLCDRLIYLICGESIDSGTEPDAKVIQNGEKYQLDTYDALGNERHKAVCELRGISVDELCKKYDYIDIYPEFMWSIGRAIGLRHGAGFEEVINRLIYLLGADTILKEDGDGMARGDFERGNVPCDSVGARDVPEEAVVDECNFSGVESDIDAQDDGANPAETSEGHSDRVSLDTPSSITDELRRYVAETWDGSMYVNQVPKNLRTIADRIDAQFNRICSQHESVLQHTLSGAVDEHEREMAELMKKLSARDAVIDSYHERMKGLDEAERRMAVAESKCEELRKMLIMQDYVRGVIDQEEAGRRIERLRDARD